jgi:hypothetical protein
MRLALCITFLLTRGSILAEQEEGLVENRIVETGDRIKNSRVEFFANASHAVFVDDPIKFNTLDYFLTEVAY